MWVTVPAQILARPASIPAASGAAAGIGGILTRKQPVASGCQVQPPARLPATRSRSGQHPGRDMPESMFASASGAAHSQAGHSASARLVDASKSAARPRSGTADGSGHQPVGKSNQRQRPKPRRAPAVVLEVIDDRAAHGAPAQLSAGPATSAAVPIYERAAAGLGAAVPAQPSALGSVAAGGTTSAAGERLASIASVQAEQAARQGSAAGADAAAAHCPVDVHIQGGPDLGDGITGAVAAPLPLHHAARATPATEQQAGEQHQADARSADPVAGGSLGDKGTRAPAAHGTVPLPEIAALSLDASLEVATAGHAAAEVQPALQNSAAAQTDVQEPGTRAETNAGGRTQTSSAAAATQSSAAVDLRVAALRRPKKRRRKAHGSDRLLQGVNGRRLVI